MPAKTPAILTLTYTDGTESKLFDLSADRLTLIAQLFPTPAPTPVSAPQKPAVVVAAPPPPPPPPPLPPITRLIAPAVNNRGDGIVNRSAADLHIAGFEQNIILQDGRDYSFTNVRSVDAWRNDPLPGKDVQGTEGQGCYVGVGGNISFAEFYAARNGWQFGRPPREKNIFRHNWYINAGGSLTATDFVLTAGASIGGKIMRVSKLKRGFIHRNAIGLALLLGVSEMEDVTFFGSSYHWTGTAWAGGIMIDAYADLKLTRCSFIYEPTIAIPAVIPGLTEKAYNGGCIKMSWSHPQYGRSVGTGIQAADCLIVGPAGESNTGHVFAGDVLLNGPQDIPGFKVIRGPGVTYDPTPVFQAIEANTISIADARKKLADDVLALVK